MAIDYPNSPTNGQIYTVGAKSWIWDGTTWLTYGASLSPSVLKVDSVNNRVGINNQSPTQALDVTGVINSRLGSGYDSLAFVGPPSGGANYSAVITTNALSTSRTYTFPNATGTVALTSDITTAISNVGLVLVKSQAVTGTASSVVVTNAFSSTYDNYEIIYTGTALAGTDAQFFCQLGSATTNYRTTILYNVNSTTPLATTTTTQQGFPWVGGGSGNDAYAHFSYSSHF